MKLIFNIEYRTHWGEDVRVMGNVPEFGNLQAPAALPLHTVDGIHWTAEADLKVPANKTVQYSYHIFQGEAVTRSEWNSIPRTLHVPNSKKKVFRLNDYWKDLPQNLALYTSAFTESLMAHSKRAALPANHAQGLLIKAYAPEVDKSLGLFIPLIVVNCIILGRAEAFAAKNGVVSSICDGIGMGIGFTLALTLLGAVRELLGTGKVFNTTLFPEEYGALVFVLAPGAFIALGYLIAIFNKIKKA